MMLQDTMAIRRKNAREYFRNATEHFLPWVHELARRYKSRGEFPLMASWLLPSYYTDYRDVEIAALAAALIKDDARQYQHVREFRRVIGDKPYQWFITRGFVQYGMGNRMMHNTAGVRNGTLAEYFALLWDSWNDRHNQLPDIFARVFYADYHQVRYDTLRLVLGTSDGIGRGVWIITPPEPRCPLTNDIKAFVNTFCPKYRQMGTMHDAVRMFRFERDSDFFYAALGYKELQRRNPDGCSRLATIYQNRYKQGCVLPLAYWTGKRRGILPPIEI